uniref:DNA polymerase III subunit delta n=1 Tax=Ammonifex degensii TaxID=42838 RepID=A0A7C1JLI6_9THEO
MRYFLNLLAEIEKGEILPVYLFYGPEVYLQREAVRRFREAIVGENPLNYEVLDGEEVPAREVAAIAKTVPLFSSRRLVVVKNAPYFAGRDENPDLLAYLRRPNTATCLIFSTSGPVDKKALAFKLVTQEGKAIEFTYLAPEDLKKWFQKKARQMGKSLEPAALEALLGAGRSLSILNYEVEKVLAYAGEKPVVTLSDVKAVLVPANEESVFAAIDAFGERRYPEALRKIRLLLEREHPGVVFTLLVRQLRLIMLAQDLAAAGWQGNLAEALNIHSFAARKVALAASRFPRAELEALFWTLLELDAAVKTGREEFLSGLEDRLLLEVVRQKNLEKT